MVVIDASALIEFLLDAAAYPRIGEIIGTHELHAPHLIDVEILHGLRSAVIGKRIDAPRALDALHDYAALVIQRHAVEQHLPRMWELRNNHTAYDASYVALAESLDLPLITRDRRLSQSTGHAARIEYIA
jgi:predicted nucleic acid-binding protein